MVFNNFGVPGTVYTTADKLIANGQPIRVFGVHEIYGAGAVGSVLRNGQDATGTIYVQLTATDSTGVSTHFNEGMLFPDGCFYDEGTSVTSAAIICHAEA